MMKKLLTLLIVVTVGYSGYCQEDAWVYFNDKENVESSLNNPNSILTQRAIDRKERHGISIDQRDVPLNEEYKRQVEAQNGIAVLAKSKWLNALHIRGSEENIRSLMALDFVNNIEFANKNISSPGRLRNQQNKFVLENETQMFVYGQAQNQVEMLNVDDLHLADYTGAGMLIAVMDSGFPNVETMGAFARLRANGGYLGGYDFPGKTNNVTAYSGGDHGTKVLSTMAGYIENQFVGTAPDASYYIFRTEVGESENPVEESYWVEAAERADSLGVDILNTSLGYTTYDNPNYNYTPSDMDGKTTYITRGANIAAEKGLMVVTSAGNSGNTSWQTVGAPADGPGVFSIGAVDASENYASFSSRGSSAQPTQKPDVVAQGASAAVINRFNNIAFNSGTSFSSPILAGSIASLWQAMPEKTANELKQLIRDAGSRSDSPNDFIGYGIPNMAFALNNVLSTEDKNVIEFRMYPNPTFSDLHFQSTTSLDDLKFSVYDVLGKKIMSEAKLDSGNTLSVSHLTTGVYLLKIMSKNSEKTLKFIKS